MIFGTIFERVPEPHQLWGKAEREAGRDGCSTPGCPRYGGTVDHIIPRGIGGADLPSNYQLLCEPCHRAKSQAELKEYPFLQITNGFRRHAWRTFDTEYGMAAEADTTFPLRYWQRIEERDGFGAIEYPRLPMQPSGIPLRVPARAMSRSQVQEKGTP